MYRRADPWSGRTAGFRGHPDHPATHRHGGRTARPPPRESVSDGQLGVRGPLRPADRSGRIGIPDDQRPGGRAAGRPDPVGSRRARHPRAARRAVRQRYGGPVNPVRSIETIGPLLGKDLRLDYALGGGFFEDADLASAKRADHPGGQRDLEVSDGITTFVQAVANRLKTRKGELAALGHPEYGSRLHDRIAEPTAVRIRTTTN